MTRGKDTAWGGRATTAPGPMVHDGGISETGGRTMWVCSRIAAAGGSGAIALALVVVLGGEVRAQQEPLDVDQTERVRVRLVILDAVVVDRRGRTVPGLGRDDFEVIVDGRPRPIDTLDVNCPGGAMNEPHGVQNPANREAIPAPPTGRRIVLAMDYLHFGGSVDVLERAKYMVREMEGDGEEIMVVALNGGLRIEQKFTSDRQAVWDALHRMEYDISLWNGVFSHSNELGFFNGLQALMNLLESLPGSKAVVLFSTVDVPASMNDNLYASLAGNAVSSRTAIYTVQADGIQPPSLGTSTAPGLRTSSEGGSIHMTPIGGSAMMKRLAFDTGGTYTRGTNDLSLGYARAQRDLGCRYAVGIYDDEAGFDESRQVQLRVKRPGLRAIHPSNYRFRSPEARRETSLMSAFLAPEMFENGVVRTHIFPVRPRKPRLWETVVAVSFPAPVGGEHGALAAHEFGAVIKLGNRVVHHFSWKVTLRARDDSRESWPTVTFLEPLELKSGRYTVSAVVSGFAGGAPSATIAEFDLPRIDRKALLTEPILWRRPSGNVVLGSSDAVESGGSLRETGMGAHLENYEPLLIQRARADEDLHVMTQYCVAGSRARDAGTSIERDLLGRDGSHIGSLPAVSLQPEGTGKVRCQGLWDELPAASLKPGDYRFEARVEPGKMLASQLRFAVDAAAEGP